MSYITDHTDPGTLVWVIVTKDRQGRPRGVEKTTHQIFLTQEDAEFEFERLEDTSWPDIRDYCKVHALILIRAVETDFVTQPAVNTGRASSAAPNISAQPRSRDEETP